MSEMNAIVVEKYGGIENLVHKLVPKPTKLEEYDILVQVKATSVNPIDMKVRAGVYDDYADYYDHVPKPKPGEGGYQIIGFDGAGVVEQVGSNVRGFASGDEIYYSGSPIRQGSNAEYQLVDSRAVAKKPKNLDFIQSAALPLTWITAYEALVERMEIKKGEKAGILIINGSGGVGSVASQIARTVLDLPVVVTTTSRPETTEFSKSMGATHTVNHREDLPSQIEKLELKVPIKYIFITHSTTPYMEPAAKICAPFGKVCSIVQAKDIQMYGTEFMAKSLSFIWELLGTKPWYKIDLESHGKILEELRQLIEDGKVKTHLQQSFRLDLKGLRKAHEAIESGGSMGKNALSVDFGEGSAPFT
ncbi:GroES-like protein [Aureobasidium pullulans]|uniref:GroES-like protein n=1 Tax=Aureobasidium pullulans TaxID=5580 RepID=A0A4S9YIF2_AURPU|nr:GroES-like protein [Aureobasidium pullulans]THW52815.1 GroES-like protein [Aureobasidium pullulans]THW68058.1 GroES-like protein [Aureobasidium pullulans]THZ78660.1 GroES-like protein [Aureobasidium pullulans]THZ91917.1 GroES-like protein [Aureobasidium pullulans]